MSVTFVQAATGRRPGSAACARLNDTQAPQRLARQTESTLWCCFRSDLLTSDSSVQRMLTDQQAASRVPADVIAHGARTDARLEPTLLATFGSGVSGAFATFARRSSIRIAIRDRRVDVLRWSCVRAYQPDGSAASILKSWEHCGRFPSPGWTSCQASCRQRALGPFCNRLKRGRTVSGSDSVSLKLSKTLPVHTQ
jgi:hypothetical protein